MLFKKKKIANLTENVVSTILAQSYQKYFIEIEEKVLRLKSNLTDNLIVQTTGNFIENSVTFTGEFSAYKVILSGQDAEQIISMVKLGNPLFSIKGRTETGYALYCFMENWYYSASIYNII